MVQAEQRRGLPAQVVHEAIRREGEAELARPASALAWSALAAGLSMGFSLVAEGLLRAHLPDAPWRPVIAKLGYSVGFLIVVLGRQQLFTENTLTVILPLLTKMDRATLGRIVRLWSIVLGANLLGALLFALAIAHTDVFGSATRAVFAQIGLESIRGGPMTILVRGIFAGWLIALMVWLLPAAEGSKVWVILVLTYVVGLGGLAHVIAGSVETLFAAVSGLASPFTWAGWFVPTLIGNVIGGVSLVAALNHAQVVSGQGEVGRAPD